MTQKLIVGPFGRGLRNDIPAFYVDNDSFPSLVNAYQWRARIKRKRGTSPICRLERWFDSTNSSYGSTSSFVLDGSGNGNLLTGFSLDSTGNIVPGHTQFTDSTSGQTYTDANQDGTLQGSGGGTGTINYATGAISITGGAGHTINTATFSYFPSLPVMDIEGLELTPTQFPQTLAFDTIYSYQIVTAFPYYAYDVSFFKNPPASGALPGYVQKTNPTPVRWHGQNYQQFWSVAYENAEWATNGITQPFSTTNIGMQFKPIVTVTIVAAGPPAKATLQITAHGLVVGDFVFVNEVATTTGINLQTGYVVTVTDANNVVVEFPLATIANAGTGGIAQYLTSNAAVPTKDCIRWYDGDPTGGQQFNPTFSSQGNGWVNFMPPLSLGTGQVPPIENLPNNVIYYLVGARMIIPYRDRLLFLGPVIQSSSTGPFYLQDTVIYSENGTPYYTASFAYSTVVPSAAIFSTTTFQAMLTPVNQGALPAAYFTDVAGFGGYITAGYQQPITTAGYNQDVLIVGFTNRQTKLLYTGNDLLPFNFYIVNSELGATATFSSIVMDRGVYTVGDRGFTITDQQSSRRIDLEIPDQVFEFDLLHNGTERITAQRDFVNEWIYFTYPSGTEENTTIPYPNQTLFYNYRDNSWAIFNESYTTYGPFRRQSGFTWQTVGSIFPTWEAWQEGWLESESSLLQPEVLAGNQEGFVVLREDGTTGEAPSLTITAVSGNTLTVPNHGLNTGDFIYVQNAIGVANLNSYPPTAITGATQANPCVLTMSNIFVVGQQITISEVAGMTQLNGNTYTITAVSPTTVSINVDSTGFTAYASGGVATISGQGPFLIWTVTVVDANTLTITSNPANAPVVPSGTYRGNGTITRLYVPLIQSKQFPMAWDLGRKTRIGAQQYLFTTTGNAQITLNLYLSQNAGDAFNQPPYVPAANSQNNSIIFSNILYTCQESTNLGLTPANINLQQLVPEQQQTWHRQNSSLIGDTVQVGFTLSPDQMFDVNLVNSVAEIELHGMVINVSPSQMLA